MASKPKELKAAPKPQGPLGAYRTDGGGFASYDAEGRTRIINEATAEALGIMGADQ